MAISKVIYGDDTLIDLTSDTVSSETLAVGATAHNSAGEMVIGAVTLLTVEEIAQQVHMSKYGLCHYYAQNVGTTVLRELQEIRVAKAKQLLRFTDRPVAEIGNLCGYDSASYFGKRFKEIAGCTPGDYRIQRKK